MATARGVGTMTPLPVSSQNRAFAHMTSLLSSRTCRYSGPSAGTGLWSPIKCGEIFRSICGPYYDSTPIPPSLLPSVLPHSPAVAPPDFCTHAVSSSRNASSPTPCHQPFALLSPAHPPLLPSTSMTSSRRSSLRSFPKESHSSLGFVCFVSAEVCRRPCSISSLRDPG